MTYHLHIRFTLHSLFEAPRPPHSYYNPSRVDHEHAHTTVTRHTPPGSHFIPSVLNFKSAPRTAPRPVEMPPLRKMDRRRSEQTQPMAEIKMSAVSLTSSPSPYHESYRQSQDSFLEPPPSSHPIYGNYRENPSFEQFEHQRLSRRTGTDSPNGAYPDQMTDIGSDSTLDVRHGAYPSFAPGAHSSYSGSQTRSSSPFPAPSPFRSQETLRPLYPEAPSTFFQRDWVKEGLIAQLHSRDDQEFLSGKKRWLFRFFAPILCLASLLMYWFYCAYTSRCSLCEANE